jgi:uncharacterized protein YdcH (DUF465 family)
MEMHNLVSEFPEHKERIHFLKMNDHHFARLATEYHEVDKEVCRLEQSMVTSDAHLENLKKHRLQLKDDLYSILQAAS